MFSRRSVFHAVIASEDLEAQKTLQELLAKQGWDTSCVSETGQLPELWKKKTYQILVCDFALAPGGLVVLKKIKSVNEHIEVIFLTDSVSEAVLAMRAGALDCLQKPLRAEDVNTVISHAYQYIANGKQFDPKSTADKMESLGRLVSGMAHEINNPLTAVIGYAQLLMDTGGQDLQKNLKVIKEQAQRCGKIIQDLMVFSRRRKPQMDRVDLGQTLNQAIEMSMPDLAARHIQISSPLPESKVSVCGDSIQLRRVFCQLINNAAQSIDGKNPEKKIVVEMESNGTMAEVTVRDTGCGITAQNIERIFEPFFTTKDVGKGTGLGLSLCHGLITEHGGTIRVNSEVDKGSVFTVCLPLAETAGTFDTGRTVPIGSAAGNKRLLVVEDEEVISGFIKKILTDQGYEVVEAGDGETAYNILQRDYFDLILCDYRIPRKNGIEILDSLKAHIPGIEKRFIFVTASLGLAGEIDAMKVHSSGVGIIVKPFTASELIKAVQERLRLPAVTK